MFDPKRFSAVHCIGIGGIHVSAVARLLAHQGIRVTGSDAVAGEETERLIGEGIAVVIGHDASNVPSGVDAVVYSDAVPVENSERLEAERRGIPSMDTHRFLGELFRDAAQIVVTGTHGKSTTTSMIGTMLEAAGVNPTVVVGTRVPGFPLGNLRIGREDMLVVEGDEFKSHVLSYAPTMLVVTNMEWDHPDVFPTAEAYDQLFTDVLGRVRDGGSVVILRDDPRMQAWMTAHAADAERRGVRMIAVSALTDMRLGVPGDMNRRNAALALAAVQALDPSVDVGRVKAALASFSGVWRRFERVGTFNEVPIISDYGHHPTEIRETLKAAREAYPGRRLVLCYQPHQHARTKGLFADFIPVLADAEALILAEIYDVPGRKEETDAHVSSRQLLEAIGPASGIRSYASDPEDAERQLRAIIQPNDLVLVMGAGTIDRVARNLVSHITT